ncbi:MAG: C-GCAxxG-C-C family protein [Candidatus Thorarchaeota archaeon]
MSRIEEAVASFRGNFNCAQSILGTYGIEYGINRDTALKLATGFGGGMARFGRTCGAVSAAFMVIGLKYGMGIKGNTELKEKTYQLIREFSDRFQEINGSVICKELLECDINTPEGKNFYSQNNLFDKKCLQFVNNVAEILEEIL